MNVRPPVGDMRPVPFVRRHAQLGPFATGVLALGLVAGGCTSSSSSTVPPTQSSATASPTPTPTLIAITTSAPTPTPTATTIGPCDPAKLAARITQWEGAAGHRIAHVELTNTGSGPCIVGMMARPQLVDGHGSVLIDGSGPPSSGFLTAAPGSIVKTLVQDGNYCGPAPVPPVTVAFVLSGGGRIVASPVSPTDATVPPCLGAPGSAGDIQMQPWAP